VKSYSDFDFPEGVVGLDRSAWEGTLRSLAFFHFPLDLLEEVTESSKSIRHQQLH
jgi:hypothetical protein